MEERKARVIFNKNGNGFLTTKITIPVPWIREMGLAYDDKDVILKFDNKIIEIKKEE